MHRMQLAPVAISLSLSHHPYTESEGVNFINVLRAHFLYESLLSSFSLLRVWLWTNFRTKNGHIICWWNKPKDSKESIFTLGFTPWQTSHVLIFRHENKGSEIAIIVCKEREKIVIKCKATKRSLLVWTKLCNDV